MSAENSGTLSLKEHIRELRNRLLRALLVLLLVFAALYPFANRLFLWLSAPLRAALPEGSSMIAIHVASPFVIPMKVALVAAFFVVAPYLLYQAWAFVAPGLYRHERRWSWPLLACSVVLFYLGAAFAGFLVLPLVFSFLLGATPAGVLPMTDISAFLDFVLMMLPVFAVAFQVPVFTFVLVRSGITSTEFLAGQRSYVIVGAFAVGMVLTPPDIISQTLLALPVWLLYEVGLLAARCIPVEPVEPVEAV
ncbi:MAG: twin-arginine translocase subunit TatC [Halomonadaceae bacterium]|nr:MAG: twin-arginine translocase subunit TatC [Halomonadaceae bacterium]